MWDRGGVVVGAGVFVATEAEIVGSEFSELLDSFLATLLVA